MGDKLQEELRALLNKHSAENGSNTPDFILATYMLNCLSAFDIAISMREHWYGKDNGNQTERISLG